MKLAPQFLCIKYTIMLGRLYNNLLKYCLARKKIQHNLLRVFHTGSIVLALFSDTLLFCRYCKQIIY